MDVVFVKRQGRFSGEAFVVLPGMMQVEFALGKHKAYMGKRYVEVQSADKEVWQIAILKLLLHAYLHVVSAADASSHKLI